MHKTSLCLIITFLLTIIGSLAAMAWDSNQQEALQSAQLAGTAHLSSLIFIDISDSEQLAYWANHNNCSLLEEAARQGRSDVVEELLQAGTDANIDEGSALACAVYHGKVSVVDVLLAHKEIKVDTQGLCSPLNIAIAVGNAVLVKNILAHLKERDMFNCINQRYGKKQHTLLHLACMPRDNLDDNAVTMLPDIVAQLLACDGIDVDAKNTDGKTACDLVLEVRSTKIEFVWQQTGARILQLIDDFIQRKHTDNNNKEHR